MPRLQTAAAFLVLALAARPADWNRIGGDRKRTHRQPHETLLSPATAPQIRRLWTRKVGTNPTPPVILGHLISHRGTVELVFVADSTGKVTAIDGDLGSVFWTRQLPATPCELALAPGPETEEDDAYQAPRPLYAATREGQTYTLRPADGQILSVARRQPACRPDSSRTSTPGWRYSLTRNPARIRAVSATGASWTSAVLDNPSTPVAAGGLILVRDARALLALDAATGRELHRNEPIPASTPLAVANGHIVFASQDGAVHCYGIPQEQ